MSEIRVTLFQLLQWKHWLRMEIKMGEPVRYKGRSVKAHVARHFGLGAREKREVVLAHVQAAEAACRDAGAGMLQVVSLSPGGNAE
jgi:hypothetical protein